MPSGLQSTVCIGPASPSWWSALATHRVVRSRVLAQFVAYARLGEAFAAGEVSARARVLATYALCGFANVGSMGIMVGGLGTLAPQKRDVLTREVFRALVAGTLTCVATAFVAAAVYGAQGQEAAPDNDEPTCFDLTGGA